MLKVASAALSKVSAARFDSQGRWLKDGDNFGKRGPFLNSIYPYANKIARRCKRDKDREPLGKRKAKPARDDLSDSNINFVAYLMNVACRTHL